MLGYEFPATLFLITKEKFYVVTTAIYQFEGDYFSGVYVYGTDADAVQRSAAKLGAASAKLLAEAAAGKPGTGGGPLAAPEQSAPGIQA